MGGAGEGGGPAGRASTASGPGEPSACGPRFPWGGYPLEAKKGVRKMKVGGRIWRGVPVLTTYTPPARGLGFLGRIDTRRKPMWM